ncbi:MAG: SH3 domain-containing protein [Candidatus Dormibacteraeota bacterium]|nr:SH3 domain-containing protein [Candidatus Dormibacteraeota bacterium]
MRSALRLIPLMVIGAVAAFLLVGPLTSLFKTPAVAGRPQPSARTTVDPHPAPTSCPASLPMPKSPLATASIGAPAFPVPVWVNIPLGVNLRSAASASSTRLSTLSQGTQAVADSRVTGPDGNPWYHVKVGSQTGFVRADFMATTPLHPVSGTGWALMLPQDLLAKTTDPSLMVMGRAGDDLPFLTVKTSTSGTLALPVPATVRADLAPVQDHNATIQVWNYDTVVEQVSRVALDTCKVPMAWARADQGWPYQVSVFVHTTGRDYEFYFLTSDPNSPLVKQVLDSISLS